jgi:hypothetical protein
VLISRSDATGGVERTDAKAELVINQVSFLSEDYMWETSCFDFTAKKSMRKLTFCMTSNSSLRLLNFVVAKDF